MLNQLQRGDEPALRPCRRSGFLRRPWVDAPEVMAIGAGIPIRRDCRLVGVAEVDVSLSNISSYLASLPMGGRG